MLQIKSNSKNSTGRWVWCSVLALLFFGWSAGAGLCAEVAFETARKVAERKLVHHVALYGSWNGHAAPVIAEGEAVRYDNQVVAYNFTVEPSGHVLVAVDDALSPILLYSERARFDPDRAYDPVAIESWIVPEVDHQLKQFRNGAASVPNDRSSSALSQNRARTQIAEAWQFYIAPASERSSFTQSSPTSTLRSAAVGPLLKTIWGQDAPYNLATPNDDCVSGHTYTGCVATAWAQLLRYWQWPPHGDGSKNYIWYSATGGAQEIEVDFSGVAYDWSSMPDELTESSTQVQKDAVSLLMYHMGVASETQFGCDSSESELYADEVLARYFGYDPNLVLIRRDPGYEPLEWFNLFKAEFEADPPRPVILSIFPTDGVGGHEVVADGYQSDGTNLIHINYGWKGSYDGFYNITADFQSIPGLTWSANTQAAVVHIRPAGGTTPINPSSGSSTRSSGGGGGGCFITSLH